MYFSIVFDQTGDSIPFETINSVAAELLCYYQENLTNQNLNKFTSVVDVGNILNLKIHTLHADLVDCNQWIPEILDKSLDTYNIEDYLDQNILNKIHADWVNSHGIKYDIQEKRKKYNSLTTELIHDMFPDSIPVTTAGTVISKLGRMQPYNKINLDVHGLEYYFKELVFKIKDKDWVEFPNPFPQSVLTNDQSNFTLTFHHLGRTLYNKFMCFDMELDYDDENSFKELIGMISIKLVPPQTIPLSKEYVAWCSKHNKTPSGDFLNIGNIPNLNSKLNDYRKIIFKNSLQNNAFSIQLNKG